jgi:hypothetical protein
MDNYTDDDSIDKIRTSLGTLSNDAYSYINNLFENPIVASILVFFLIYIIIFLYLGDNSQSVSNNTGLNSGLNASSNNGLNGSSNTSSATFTNIILLFFLVFILLNSLKYFFDIDIVAIIINLFTENPNNITEDTSKPEDIKEPEDIKAQVPQITLSPQVFNIPENDFNYSDAKALCSAYGARLATYDEIEDTYKNGGEWCNYGWSDSQMALFPTQKQTYDKLQKIEGHENDCGRPGVNGGYIENPLVKFGVNCYGYKPRMTELEKEIMATRPIYPKTMKDKELENRVNYWKDKLTEILVSPFNHSSWSKL